MNNHLATLLLTCNLLMLCTEVAAAAPLGPPGTVAEYELNGPPEDRTDFEYQNRLSVVKATIRLGPVERPRGEKARQWYGLQFSRLNGDTYQLWILLDGWPTADHDPGVYGYLWREPGWPDAVSFVHEVTGEAQLPRLCLWTYGWPQVPDLGGGSNRAPSKGLPEEILLQGWRFKRVGLEHGTPIPPPTEHTRVALNPDLVIGWVYNSDHDEDGRPDYRLESGAYRWRDKTFEEIEADLDAGFNFFVSRGKRPIYPANLERRGVYHSNLNSNTYFESWPAMLYRSNYWGMRNHIDEPGVANFGRSFDEDEDAPRPEIQAVESLVQVIEGAWEGQGREHINESFDGRVPAKGDMHLIDAESSIASWEYEWPTAWYQLALDNRVGFLVDEDAMNNDLVETYNMAFGTQIPPTVQNACAIRVAVLRGAARNFDKRWGIAIYFPNEVKLKSASLPYFYEKGASHFWFWIAYPPYPYKRYYATMVRECFQRNPDRDMHALLHKAKVAVVIPYGYTFAPYNMHRIAWLPLEKENEHGITYRKVLSNAATEVERLIRMGVEFDVAIDDPRFHKTGYEELIYAQADGKIRIDRPGHDSEWLEAPREFPRPHLGEYPKLTLEVVETDNDKPGRIRFRAVAEIGTGEWAGERSEPLIYWEIYNPDGTVSPSIFPEYGAERMLRVEDNVRYTMRHPIPEHLMTDSMKQKAVVGSYTVRAATADIFGRPAIAYKTVYVDESGE